MGGVYTFGSLLLDVGAKRLLRDGTPIVLPAIQFALLHALVERAGDVLTKEELIAAGWKQTFVEDNTLAKAMLRLRRALDPDPEAYIATAARQGYRFAAVATRVVVEQTEADAQARLAPYRAFVDGRALLETLDRQKIILARQLFEQAVRRDPGEAANHVGLANACVLQYEATRVALAPDLDAIRIAAVHAREACRLNGAHAEASATLGFILHRQALRADAIAALRRAVALEEGNWRHHVRLAWVSWGEERLASVRRTRAIVAHPLADLLSATVVIARAGFADAERDIDAGRMTMACEGGAPARYAVVGLDVVKGLLSLARGDSGAAREAFEREIARESSGHLFAREYAAHAWYALGACRLRDDDAPGAREAFEHAIALAPRHAMARAGLAIVASAPELGVRDVPPSFDATLAAAAVRVVRGDDGADAAIDLVADALAAAPEGSTGWMIPIDPLLNVARSPERWRRVLGTLRSRAL